MATFELQKFGRQEQTEYAEMVGDYISKVFETNHRVESALPFDAAIRINYDVADGSRVSLADMPPLVIHNMGGHLKSKPKRPKYIAYRTDQEQSIYTQNDVLHLQPNELLLVRSDSPKKIITSKSYRTSALIIEEDLVRELIPDADSLAGRRLTFPYGIEHVLHNMMESILALLGSPDSQRFAAVTPKLVHSFLEVLALSELRRQKPAKAEERTSIHIRRGQICEIIKRNYASPTLTIGSIARSLNLSTRYVQMAFCEDELTPSEMLRKCRLEACAEILRDPDEKRRSITDIAFSCGFNSSGHFSCLFKQAYDMTPREYRAFHIGE